MQKAEVKKDSSGVFGDNIFDFVKRTFMLMLVKGISWFFW